MHDIQIKIESYSKENIKYKYYIPVKYTEVEQKMGYTFLLKVRLVQVLYRSMLS